MSTFRVKQLFKMMALAVLIVGVSACEELVSVLSSNKTSETGGVTGEISIGVVLSLSGPPAAAYGLPMYRGFDLALEEIIAAQLGAQRIKLITMDDEGSVEGAVEAYMELIENQGVPVILGLDTRTKWGRPFRLRSRITSWLLAPYPLPLAWGR